MSCDTSKPLVPLARPDHDMLTGPVVRTFWKYCLPWSLSMVASGSATVVDGIFIGRYAGAMPLASVNLIAPAFSLIAGVGVMFSTGGSVRCGKYMGEGNMQAASAMLVKTLIVLAVVISSICVAGFIWQDNLLNFLGTDDVLRPHSARYLRTLLYFFPVFPLCYALSYFVRLDQRPALASGGLMLCAGLNILLDALFVAHWKMGVYGAALATGLAYSIPSLLFVSHFFSKRCSYVRPKKLGSWDEVAYATWNGASEFVNEVSAGIIILLFNLILMERMGGHGVAAFTVVSYITMMGVMLCYGIGDSLAPIISVNRGARAYGRMNAFLATALVSVFILGVVFFTFLTLAPGVLATLFLPGEMEATAITLTFIHACRWSFLFIGLNMVLASNFTGLQWATSSMLVAVSRSFLLPIAMVYLLPGFLGDNGIFFATSVAESLAFLVAVGLLLFGRSRCPELRG